MDGDANAGASMTHHASARFWKTYNDLPAEVRVLADNAYDLLVQNPQHPSLHLKRVSKKLWSARVGRDYRALATKVDDGFQWIWIGPPTNTSA